MSWDPPKPMLHVQGQSMLVSNRQKGTGNGATVLLTCRGCEGPALPADGAVCWEGIT